MCARIEGSIGRFSPHEHEESSTMSNETAPESPSTPPQAPPYPPTPPLGAPTDPAAGQPLPGAAPVPPQSAPQQPFSAPPQAPQYSTAAPQPGYAAPQQPLYAAPQPPAYAAVPERRTNILAILALVFAFVCAPAGIILGHISLSQIKKSGEEGRGLALAGTIISYVITAFALIWMIVWFGFMVWVMSDPYVVTDDFWNS